MYVCVTVAVLIALLLLYYGYHHHQSILPFTQECFIPLTQKTVSYKEPSGNVLPLTQWYTKVTVGGNSYDVIVDMGSSPLVVRDYKVTGKVCDTGNCLNTTHIRYAVGNFPASPYTDVLSIPCMKKRQLNMAAVDSKFPVSGVLGLTDVKSAKGRSGKQITGFVDWDVLDSITIYPPVSKRAGKMLFNKAPSSDISLVNRVYPQNLSNMQMNFYVVQINLNSVNYTAIMDNGMDELVIPKSVKTAFGNSKVFLSIPGTKISIGLSDSVITTSSMPFIFMGRKVLELFDCIYLSKNLIGFKV